jgi:hypothetical protein
MRVSSHRDVTHPSMDILKNNFAVLSVGNGRKKPVPYLPPCELIFMKVCIKAYKIESVSQNNLLTPLQQPEQQNKCFQIGPDR